MGIIRNLSGEAISRYIQTSEEKQLLCGHTVGEFDGK
jgi:hypothetical protein